MEKQVSRFEKTVKIAVGALALVSISISFIRSKENNEHKVKISGDDVLVSNQDDFTSSKSKYLNYGGGICSGFCGACPGCFRLNN